ncbi:MAG: fluoride efflux transporter CrcB [Christensenellales bacterium]|jgi:CrcB protein
MDILLVGLGGAAGSVARYAIGRAVSSRTRGAFPWGTFLVNIKGALLLGIVVGLDVPRNAALLAADGFLGAYTTFSTFMYDGFRLFKSSRVNAAVYIAGMLVLGIACFGAGSLLAGIVR